MSKITKQQALWSALFNASNLAATGGILLSAGMGSRIGSALFVSALCIGSYNKYNALLSSNDNPDVTPGIVTQALQSPTLTARILMVGAGWNCVDAAADIFIGPAAEQNANICRTAGWAMGVLGDNALRQLDKVNFSLREIYYNVAGSKMRQSLETAIANPSLFYKGSVIAFAASMLTHTSFLSFKGIVGSATIALSGAAIAHTARRTWQAAHDKVSFEAINDGFSNGASAAALAAQGVVAFTHGLYAFGAGHVILAGSSIKRLFETRQAIRRKQGQEDAPSPNNS